MSVTLVNRKKAAPVRSIYLENYFTARRILPVLNKKNKRCSCKKEKAVETAFFYSLTVALNIAAECIAGFQLSAVETALEPFGALG